MTKRIRRTHSAAFKAKVALAAVKGGTAAAAVQMALRRWPLASDRSALARARTARSCRSSGALRARSTTSTKGRTARASWILSAASTRMPLISDMPTRTGAAVVSPSSVESQLLTVTSTGSTCTPRRRASWMSCERDLAEERLRAYRRELFGAKSEVRSSDQPGLFNEAEVLGTNATPAQEDTPETTIAAHTRKKRGHRKPLDPSLPREVVRHELPETERFCNHDGHALVKISYIPVSLTATLTTQRASQVGTLTQTSQAHIKLNPIVSYVNVGYRF